MSLAVGISVGLLVFWCSALCRLELGDLLADIAVQSLLELWPVSEEEQDLEPYKERRKEESLHKVI